jgi:beta-mannanase
MTWPLPVPSASASSDQPDLVPPSSALTGIYRPEFPDDLSALKSYEGQLGQQLSIVHWYVAWGGWKSTFSRADLDAVAAHGSVPLITWEPWAGPGPDYSEWSLRKAILSGANDAYIESWAEGLANFGKPVLLRFAHEMHDHPSYAWAVGVNGNTADDYVAAWRHVRSIFARHPTANVEWVWNPNTLGDASADAYAPVYRSVYPGDDQVDWLGLDVFNTGPDLDWGAPRWRSFGAILSAPYTAITAVSNKPVLLPEVGSTELGGSKSDWITAVESSELAAFPRVRAVVWFDVAKKGEADWRLGSSPQAREAWVSAFAPPSFAAVAQLGRALGPG